MGYWQIVVPCATTNLLTNPSCETATTQWVADGAGSTIAQSSTYSYVGAYSLKATAGAAAGRGAYYYQIVTTTTGAHSFSFAVYSAVSTVHIKVYDGATIRYQDTSYDITANTWNVVQVENITITNGEAFQLSVLSTDNTGPIFYVDALFLEAKAYCTTYVDGAQDGCSWNGTPHAATSTRSSQWRGGGRVMDFYDDYSLPVVGMAGYGMPPLKRNATDYSILPGAYKQNTKIKSRPFTLIMEPAGGSLTTLHTRRDSLIEAIKPDLVSPEQPVRLRYTGTTNTVEIAAEYVGGLEGNLRGEDGIYERFPVQFVSDDPFFYGLSENSASLTSKLSIANANYLLKRINGTWSAFSTSPNGAVEEIVRGPDGCIYIGGNFTNLGDANGDYIAKWDPNALTWTSLGTGMNDRVRAMVFDAAGNLYAGGDFTLAGGVANTAHVAMWDGSNWNALGTGTSDDVLALVMGYDGKLYVGGNFTNLGDANGDFISYWDGSAWNSMGTGGVGGAGVYALARGLDGSIYAGGAFTSMGGVSDTSRVAKWSGGVWSALGTGMDAAIEALAVAPDGTLYAAGNFTTAGGIDADYIAKWNGSTWSPVGSHTAINNVVYSLTCVSDGTLYASGLFTSAGGITLPEGIAEWNGYSWTPFPVDLPSTVSTYCPVLIIDTDNFFSADFYIGFGTAGTAVTPALNTITAVTNIGSRTAYPVITIKRSGGTSAQVLYIKNFTTGKVLRLNYALQNNETITLDLRPGYKTAETSQWFTYGSNIIGRTALPSSDFATWGLQPGANDVAIYVSDVGTPTITAIMRWKPCYWSVDGAVS